MGRGKNSARRQFLKAMITGAPAAALSMQTATARVSGAPRSASIAGKPAGSPRYIDTAPALAGDDAILFRKHTLDLGVSETVAIEDMNGDGRLDIISGECWYEQAPPASSGQAPRWIKHKFRDLPYTDFYLEDLSDLAIDVNGDGYPDVISCSYWSKPLTWWENPGSQDKPWREHVMETGAPVEFAFLVDILNTGKSLQLLPQFGDSNFPIYWYELAGKGATNPWVRHEVGPHSPGHGIGAGDVDGNGRTDIITPTGWYEAPPDPRSGSWTFHPEFDLGGTGFIYAHDVNGDGLADLVTSAAHDYGVFWYEQKKDPGGGRAWRKHVIDDSWSQAHALTLADLNGDGMTDLVTGKRYFAHNGHDPGAHEPLGLYWYEPMTANKNLEWRRHIIDYSTRTGAGLQIPVVDIDGDGDLDIVVAGKSGLYLFENLTR